MRYILLLLLLSCSGYKSVDKCYKAELITPFGNVSKYMEVSVRMSFHKDSVIVLQAPGKALYLRVVQTLPRKQERDKVVEGYVVKGGEREYGFICSSVGGEYKTFAILGEGWILVLTVYYQKDFTV